MKPLWSNDESSNDDNKDSVYTDTCVMGIVVRNIMSLDTYKGKVE